jgi:hypothetical protein
LVYSSAPDWWCDVSDAAAVKKALLAKLESDSTLINLVPVAGEPTKAGVYFNLSPNGVTKAIVLSQIIAEDTYALRSTAFQRFLFLVKCVQRSTDTSGVDAVAARIQALLHGQALTITGYRHMTTRREEAISYAEVDDDDLDEHWQHSGGRYEIFAEPTS